MFEHIRSRIRIPIVLLVPFLIGGFAVVYLLVRDTKANQAAAVSAAQEHDATEDAELRAMLRARFASLSTIATGPETTCRDSLDALPVVQQAWVNDAVVKAPLVQTLALEQLAQPASLTPEARARRNRRLQELAIAPRVALVIVREATPIVESPGEPGKSRFSAGTLEGQLAIVELPAGNVLCRAALHVETPAFTSYAATKDSADNTRVIEDAWREPIWKAVNAALDRVGGFRAKALRD